MPNTTIRSYYNKGHYGSGMLQRYLAKILKDPSTLQESIEYGVIGVQPFRPPQYDEGTGTPRPQTQYVSDYSIPITVSQDRHDQMKAYFDSIGKWTPPAIPESDDPSLPWNQEIAEESGSANEGGQ